MNREIKPDMLCRLVGEQFPENRNAIVRTLHQTEPGVWLVEAMQTVRVTVSLIVLGIPVRRRVATKPPGTQAEVDEIGLRPLYDGDAEDEMLRIAGKPVRVGVPA